MFNVERDYYCSMKFRFLKIDLKSETIYNCDAAGSRTVDPNWLLKNPGQLFNNADSLNDRQLMLQNVRNSNCEQNCWPAEDKGAVSPRLFRHGNIKTHTEIYQQPEILDLTVNGDCNLACTYCCKEFSSNWRQDIIKNGDYKITGLPDRYQVTNKDRILNQSSQSDIRESPTYQLLLNEIKLFAPTLKTLYVTGGEPLLDNQLINILMDLPFSKNIEFNLFSGLGLSMSRFEKLVDKMKIFGDTYDNFTLKISAETTGSMYEFNRYGNTWSDFQRKIDMLTKKKINFIFHSTISNLTLFDFARFRHTYPEVNFTMDFSYQPRMLAPHVLDDDSKQVIADQLQTINDKRVDSIMQSMTADPTDIEKLNLREFLLEFTQRRPTLDLNIFPVTFLKWLNL